MKKLPAEIFIEKVAQEAERIAYGPEEAARLIGFSRNGLHSYLASGQLRSFKVGRKKRLILRSDLLSFLETMAACGLAAPTANSTKETEGDAQ